MTERPALSLVVATYRRPDKLARCLQSILDAEEPGGGFEVVVVDDGGGLPEQLRDRFARPNLLFLDLPANRGQPAAQARGGAAARAAILGFLDDDAVVDPAWLMACVEYFARHQDVGAVLGRIEPLDTRPLLARTRQCIYDRRHRRYTDPVFVEELRRAHGLRATSAPWLSDHVSGGNFAIRRHVLAGVGGLPENLRLGCDEFLSSRLLATGEAIGYEPRMRIRHEHNASLRVLLANNFGEGRDRERSRRLAGQAATARWSAAASDLVRAPLRIRGFPEMLEADRSRLKVYLLFTAIHAVDALGQLRELVAPGGAPDA